MKKKFIVLSLGLLILFAFVAPVIAGPTNGQKVPVTLKFTVIKGAPGERWDTNGNTSQRRDWRINYTVYLSIDGAAPIVGKSVDVRDAMVFRGEKVGMEVYRQDTVMSFPTEGGTFEGNEMLLLTDVNIGPPLTFYLKAHAVFHGTGAFEGQTINADYDGPQGGVWTGYLLKP